MHITTDNAPLDVTLAAMLTAGTLPTLAPTEPWDILNHMAGQAAGDACAELTEVEPMRGDADHDAEQAARELMATGWFSFDEVYWADPCMLRRTLRERIGQGRRWSQGLNRAHAELQAARELNRA